MLYYIFKEVAGNVFLRLVGQASHVVRCTSYIKREGGK
jgi:hypothetical protein